MIECQICKKSLNQLTGKHLKSHGISAAEYRSQFPGYPTDNRPIVSEETRAKMSASRTGAKHSEEAKAKIGSKHRGKKRTPEEIDKWRTSYAEYIREHGSPMLGKDRGDAFRKHMSEVAKNRPKELVQQKVEQMWAARRGSKATPEQRERYSQARLKYMQENPDKLGMKLFNTKPELEFEQVLIEHRIEYSKFVKKGNFNYDFVIDNIIIEIDGPYHWNLNLYGSKAVPESEKLEGLAKTQARDKRKSDYATSNGFTIYRIKVEGDLPEDWLNQLEAQGCELFKNKARE